jgi:ribonucleases P/MRP protein subunit RPP25
MERDKGPGANYTKVEKEKVKTEENEIRVTSKGKIKSYLGYALRIFDAEKANLRSLKIRATGNAIVKALILIELVKRRVGDLHQINEITSTEITDEYEPQVEGLERIEQKRRVTCLDCTLSKDPLDTNHIGYQPPTPKEERPERTERPQRPERTQRPEGERDQQQRPPRQQNRDQPPR